MATALITGANRGLGLEFVRQLDKSGWRIHACCRDPGRAGDLDALAKGSRGRCTVQQMDIGDFDAIDELASALHDEPIDLLLNNAGIIDPDGGSFSEEARTTLQSFGELNFEGWGEVFRINVIGSAKVTEAFVDHVAASERKTIAMISSIMGSITANAADTFPPGGGIYLYRSSKAALNMVARSLAVDLKDRDIVVLTLNPGWVKTDMGGSGGMLEPEVSVANMLKIINESNPKLSGTFLSHDRSELPW